MSQSSQPVSGSAPNHSTRTDRLPNVLLLILSLLVLIAPAQLRATNQLIGWGDGQNNQLGLANNPVSNVPVAPSNLAVLAGKDIVAVASSRAHTLVLLSDGTMYAWGLNGSGQFGNNSTTDSAIPVPVDTSGVLAGKAIKAIAVGTNNSYALDTNGAVYAWGLNGNGELGNNSTTSSLVPVRVDTSGALAGKIITAIGVGNATALALSSDGFVYAWGWPNSQQLGINTAVHQLAPVAVDTSGVLAGKTISAIAVGTSVVFALGSDHQVYSWGTNGFSGSLGNNSTSGSPTPVAVSKSGVMAGKNIVKIAASGGSGYALASTGELFSWGSNTYGQLGNGTFTDSPIPVTVTATGALAGKTITDIGADSVNAYALASDGTVYSWGASIQGALGIANPVSALNLPVAVDTSGPLAGAAVTQLQSGMGAATYFVLVAGPAATAPVITTNPTNQSISAGSNATFSAAASGNPTPTVQWQQSTDGGATFTNIASATSTTLSLTAVSGSADGNQYRAVFTNSAGSAITTAATLTVTAGPAITTNPADATVNAGGTATFTAAATGAPAPTVQWQFSTDGGATFSDVAGATSATLSVPGVLAGQNGTKFRAVFTNASGSATTTAATMTVNSAPLVTANPTSQSASASSNVTFSAAASGNPVPNVQWQQSTDGGATFTNIAGATTTTLSLTAVSASANGNQYRAVFINIAGSATTTAATLTITAGPVITTNPVDVTVNAGSTATFTAAASGAPAPTVQWQSSTDGGATFNSVAGATATTLSVPSVLAGQNGTKFRAAFTNASGTATTTAATMTVHFPPAITTNPTSQTVSVGANLSFVAAASGNPVPNVQWQQSPDGGATFNNIAGATTTTLALTAVSPSASGTLYRAVFTNTVGSATTTAATLTVTGVATAPVITTNPTSQSVSVGSNVTFTATASGNPLPNVQWQQSTDGGATFSNIAGANSTSLLLTAVSPSASGTLYRAVFTNSAGSATSSVATLTVTGVATAPVITTDPISQNISVGSDATFTAAASGNPVPNVQWQQSADGGATFTNIAGATSTTLLLTAVPASARGNLYRAVFTNVAGSATTQTATLALIAPRLINLSCRAACGTGNNVTIGGVVISGVTPKKVLVRAVGPTLSGQGLSSAEVLSDPVIEVHDMAHGITPIASNDNWGDNADAADITSVAAQVGAIPLAASDTKTAALLLTLDPGVYTFVASGKSGTSGVVLLELYDADSAGSGSSTLNFATRAQDLTGNGVTIGGFVISGNAPKQILLRGVGPTLTGAGLNQADVLADPVIELHDALHGNATIATNDNWGDNANAALITSTAARVGAMPFASTDTKSAALLLTLQPGVYTYVVSGKSATSGIVLIEVYDAD